MRISDLLTIILSEICGVHITLELNIYFYPVSHSHVHALIQQLCRFNPNYLGGRDQEDHSLKPAWANSSWDPILKIPNTKNRVGKVAQGVEFKPQYYHQKKKKSKRKFEHVAIYYFELNYTYMQNFFLSWHIVLLVLLYWLCRIWHNTFLKE
jgi:hypothetical protein